MGSQRERALGQAWDFLWRNNQSLVRITLIPSTWGASPWEEGKGVTMIPQLFYYVAICPQQCFHVSEKQAVMGLSVPITPQEKEDVRSSRGLTKQLASTHALRQRTHHSCFWTHTPWRTYCNYSHAHGQKQRLRPWTERDTGTHQDQQKIKGRGELPCQTPETHIKSNLLHSLPRQWHPAPGPALLPEKSTCNACW